MEVAPSVERRGHSTKQDNAAMGKVPIKPVGEEGSSLEEGVAHVGRRGELGFWGLAFCGWPGEGGDNPQFNFFLPR